MTNAHSTFTIGKSKEYTKPTSSGQGPQIPIFSTPVTRFRFGDYSESIVKNPHFYKIEHKTVNRVTYENWLEKAGLFQLTDVPDLGEGGPQRYLPVLVRYLKTGEQRYGVAIIEMLKSWHRATLASIKKQGWTEQFIEEPAFIPLYRKHLIQGGLLKPEDSWFKSLWLDYCRNLHVWGSKPTEWRGGCHRAMPEAISKGLAAKWYPDIPEAEHWKRYAKLGFDDFWRHKEVQQNDTGYFPGPIFMLLTCGEEYLGDDRAVTDPGMQRLWNRLLAEITPDGCINPFGPNGGWNSTAAFRMFALELVAAKTRIGQYRFGAHRLMNYIQSITTSILEDTFLTEREYGQHIALSWLFADDSVKPVEPRQTSLWNERLEAARIPHTDKVLFAQRFGNPDPHPEKGHVCCSWWISGKKWPDKLILRSGWKPGDLFGIIEVHPTSFPHNAGGIMGLNYLGAAFTQVVTSKGESVENRLEITDITGRAKRQFHADKVRINENWQPGKMPDIQSSVEHFEDKPNVTTAKITVRNFDGFTAIYQREIVFVKNRFLATREIITFPDPFEARLSAIWNTRNIGRQIGTHWANTYMGSLVASNGQVEVSIPPVDLLVWFSPNAGRSLRVVDRLVDDPRATACSAQLRYEWIGNPDRNVPIVFTQVYYPHPPYKPTVATNNPGAKASFASDKLATAGASGITVIRDDYEGTILRLEMEPKRVEWVYFNPNGGSMSLSGKPIIEKYGYIVESL